MKEQAKVPVIVIVVVLVAALLFYFGSKAFKAGNLDQGQVNYTPGKPPWQETDPSKKGPGGPPGGGGFGNTQQDTTQAGSATIVQEGGQQRAPAGMTPPTVGNGS